MISIVIPVYNVENYVRSCIDSVLAQEKVDIEIVLVDDGSSDKSGKICENYSNNYTCVKTIHQENKGVTAARATGVRYSTGEFIYFVDSDDTIEPDTLFTMYQYMTDDVDLVVFEGNENITCTRNDFANFLFNYQLLAVWGKLFRKSLFDGYVFDIPRYFKVGEDFLMNLRILKNIENKIVICPIKKYLYNTSNPNSVQTENYRNYEYETKMVQEVGRIMTDLSSASIPYEGYINWQISYLGGMIGFKYKIDFNEPWIIKLKEDSVNFNLNMRSRMTIKSIDYPILRYFFIIDKKLRRFAHRILKR